MLVTPLDMGMRQTLLSVLLACLQALSLPAYTSFDKLGIDDVGARNALREVR
jgi:hypothetical protein